MLSSYRDMAIVAHEFIEVVLTYIRSAQDQANDKFQHRDWKNSKVPSLAQELLAVIAVENWYLFYFKAADSGGVLLHQRMTQCLCAYG